MSYLFCLFIFFCFLSICEVWNGWISITSFLLYFSCRFHIVPVPIVQVQYILQFHFSNHWHFQLYRYRLVYIGIYRCTGMYWYILVYTGIYWYIPVYGVYIGIYWYIPVYICIYRYMVNFLYSTNSNFVLY
jgi:hypothetical protein